MEEERSLMDDMRDDGYRFAHDLITEVIKRSGIDVPFVNFPNPENFLFTNAHKRIIREFLAEVGEYIETQVEGYAARCKDSKYSYSDFNYFDNRFKVIKEFKPEPYSEEGFVKLCAAIAQVAACNYLRNEKCDVLIHAMEDVHNFVKKVLSRGTLQHSSLADD
ncbi:hypothetical protein AVEN_70251-1 [Araneus ventricosus]|uniref:Uncharacterized protein n=1 Tax=Araneus ventricosus TaxID=182803 RepID=A0A4Y2GDE0_ARAVE|nr:hypothetical protein AVEN_70251-1 [Araneus ventricosus]